MDTAFTHLLAMLGGIADTPRAEGKLRTGSAGHVFLFSILAVMAGANSYRAIHSSPSMSTCTGSRRPSS